MRLAESFRPDLVSRATFETPSSEDTSTPSDVVRYDAEAQEVTPVALDPQRPPQWNEVPLGAIVWGTGSAFLVWAPKAKALDLICDGTPTPMAPVANGYFFTHAAGVSAGARYGYRLDGAKDIFPDPVSYRQPDGVFGLSQVVDQTQFKWTDNAWRGMPLEKMRISETHIGTQTAAGTFAAAASEFAAKLSAGFNTVEMMPVHQFPGRWNWGYDPAQIFAIHNTYGTPDELKQLVNDAHQRGQAVIADVVYNHAGPQGNYSGAYGPYFEGKQQTPWGGGVLSEGPQSREVYRHFIEHALLMLNEYHCDGLRLDATVYLPKDLLAELSAAVDQLRKKTGRHIVLISENNRNNRVVTTPREQGGHGFDGQWSMDMQYALRSLLLKESGWRIDRYAQDPFKWVAKAAARGWAFEGEMSPYEKDGGAFGTSAEGLPAASFIVAKNDHDQEGNWPGGARLGQRLSAQQDKTVDALYGFLPFTSMVFQGDEYRSKHPFYFFVDVDEPLKSQIRDGRNREWAEWLNQGGAARTFPVPGDESTFVASKLDPTERASVDSQPHAALNREIARLRRDHPALNEAANERYEVVSFAESKALMMRRWSKTGDAEVMALVNLSPEPVTLDLHHGEKILNASGADTQSRRSLKDKWKIVLSTDDARFGGDGRTPSLHELERVGVMTLPASSALYLEKR